MKFSLLFPGQGSQQPEMGKFLFDNFKIAQHVFEEASEAIGIDLKKLCFTGSLADLALTENTQPCLLLVSIATQRVLSHEFQIKMSSVAGHSVGEYAAMVSAGVIDFAQAMKSVRIRGQAMQLAVPAGEGGMLAVLGLEIPQVEILCEYAVKNSGFGPLSAANYNSPDQTVLSGSQKAIDWLKKNEKLEVIFPSSTPKRMKLIPLQVSAPFHCSMMKPAEEKMREVLSQIEFKNAKIPVVQNFTAEFEVEGVKLRENLIRQVSAPVKWMQSMYELKKNSMTTCIECGVGSVLKGLLKKIDSEAFKVFNTSNLEDLKKIEALLENEATCGDHV